MRSGRGNQEEEVFDEEEFGSRREGPSSTTTAPFINNRDGKNSDKANAMRSKHSVTEQRRRSKINERFQILRDLIPHNDQKRDTASFLLEVIEYVQYLHEKVQKYEGSYQGWSTEPAKLIPWRNSHWRIQNFVGHPQAVKNGSDPGSTFLGKYDDNNVIMNAAMQLNEQNAVESDSSREGACKPMDQQLELANNALPMPMPLQVPMVVHPLQRPVSDAQSSDCPNGTPNQQDELAIEGGTVSLSSAYSEGLLNTLTQALQGAGVDLSQARISVQIDLGKRANRGLAAGTFLAKDNEHLPSTVPALTHLRDGSCGEDFGQAQKRFKT